MSILTKADLGKYQTITGFIQHTLQAESSRNFQPRSPTGPGLAGTKSPALRPAPGGRSYPNKRPKIRSEARELTETCTQRRHRRLREDRSERSHFGNITRRLGKVFLLADVKSIRTGSRGSACQRQDHLARECVQQLSQTVADGHRGTLRILGPHVRVAQSDKGLAVPGGQRHAML